TGVTWNAAATATSNAAQRAEIWFGKVGSGASTSLTINQGAASAMQVNVSEWSGIDTTGNEKDFGVGRNVTSTILDTSTTTPTSGLNMLIVGNGRHAGSLVSGPTGGGTSGATWTAMATSTSGSNFAYTVANSTSGSYQVNWIYSASSSHDDTMAGFKAAAIT